MNNKIIDAITIEKIISQSSLQVVFLLDITGSISTQIEVAKSIIASFSEIERPMIGIHIWTIIENPGCYIIYRLQV